MVEVTELYIQMDVDSVEVIVAYILDYIYFPHVFRLKYGGLQVRFGLHGHSTLRA